VSGNASATSNGPGYGNQTDQRSIPYTDLREATRGASAGEEVPRGAWEFSPLGKLTIWVVLRRIHYAEALAASRPAGA
jgi:hypothetical protein